MEGFDAPIEHFRKTGHVGHLGHGQARLGQEFGGAPGGEQTDVEGVQGLGELNDARFVRNRKKRVHE